ncbi:light-harvesting complex-like protein OHP2, chloroplastic isoform X1 [Iris pallida]|uniref:Light-harvesting complex-like protein OHP2, chloroplastic isoform X1 n=1 Tax=Iris pallida TaxID=29817 RepID=A0AAX6FEV3_IRIPA|nr:light-harvesting complex-like protein OHP2, chloroplastic isoform X1 [Iris pallida]KAJ6814876.1 light-harvesting complex-like protein OHP2, chloroplastic isoform X1 [Iris pallida]
MSIISSSFPTIKIKVSSKFSLRPTSTIIRSSKADGPLRRPSAPSLSPPPSSPPLSTPPSIKPLSNSPSLSPPKLTEPVVAGVTLEYQRRMAKEMQDYFRKKKAEESDQGPAFGFVAKNEISNGRWAMFGFAVGLLTEYATGSDFVQQVKILLSNFGIVDLD